MKIAVTTPQGNVGRHLTRMLIRAGDRPVLLTRHPDQIPAELAEHAEPRRADSRDPDQVIAATADADAAYSTSPTRPSPTCAAATSSPTCCSRWNHSGPAGSRPCCPLRRP